MKRAKGHSSLTRHGGFCGMRILMEENVQSQAMVAQAYNSRRIAVRSQLRQIVHETLSQKTLHKNRAGGVAQGVGPELSPSTTKKRKKIPRDFSNKGRGKVSGKDFK
jgi:hypothetical protein